VELGEGLSVAEAFDALCRRYPEMADLAGSLMYAVNAEYVTPDQPLRAGDELALIPPVSGGAPDGLFEVTAEPLTRSGDRARPGRAAPSPVPGRRDNSRGRRVLYLEYDAYPEMATRVMRQIAEAAMARWPLTDIAMQHRTGRLEIGETSLVIAVASPHRREAFEACHHLVDRFKEVVPIWKKEVWEAAGLDRGRTSRRRAGLATWPKNCPRPATLLQYFPTAAPPHRPPSREDRLRPAATAATSCTSTRS
jgi:molybdopterin synthase catalytic subunit